MNRQRMRGVYVVEFAIIGLLLFALLFGVVEMGRLYFTVNTLDEVVRRGARLAAVCDPSDPVEVEKILRRAIFDAEDDDSASDLIGGLETADLNLVYLNEAGATVANPDDLVSATGFRAIRYVQLRVEGFPFELLIPGFGGVFTLPAFRSTIPRESLGRHAEAGVVPEITPC
ncbi:TadE/TadG family type IV pilus assembly protein [Pseudomonas sp. SA3-5]|uniref:TadE/TadG family type IV pilus assembly protein n=1 Tax=Pseudomonas aestuarii TaxID=3018340 RepID=A0ABT4XC59_9PSED|nr:TadE/TadG family type IV pilus assembly protein [Pseudomonas aestuarii]MDA7085784.1 TadE/TadG family type IV pilus assembly protein [Pseudomonas aestuarii]